MVLWVSGHKGILGSELADAEAKTTANTTTDPLPRPIAISLICRTTIYPPPPDCNAIYNLAYAVLLAHFRAGHTPLLKAHANVFDPSAAPLYE